VNDQGEKGSEEEAKESPRYYTKQRGRGRGSLRLISRR